MNKKIAKLLKRRKENILERLDRDQFPDHDGPVIHAGRIHYDVSDRMSGMNYGGIGMIHTMVRNLGLDEAINSHIHLLKLKMPYFESDHVLNMSYNILVGGQCLEDIELLRNDESYLNALGALRIPDPTTAGDFCRRFDPFQVDRLQDAINSVRLKVWQQQDQAFFEEALIDVDGTIAPTTGACKEGMDISYQGLWGYHPLVVSLANTQEPLFLLNRSGNSTSSSEAPGYLDQAAGLCRQGGFKKIRFRGDTDFSQTAHLDRWDNNGIEFVFGIAAMANLIQIAETLPETVWNPLNRPAKYTVKTAPRRKPVNVKEDIIHQRQYKNIRLESEHVACFDYRPTQCKNTYRIVVLRKNLSVERGDEVLFDDIRYFFYITNDRISTDAEVVRHANNRCHQENLIEQLKNGAYAMRMPLDNLVSNWAYMVITALAWSLKAWTGLLLFNSENQTEKRRHEKQKIIRMEFKKYRALFIQLPCQIVRTGRRILCRLTGWHEHLELFFRLAQSVRRPLRC